MKRPAFIFDVDGTVSNCEHRTHFIRGEGKKDWTSFYAAQPNDPPIAHMVLLCRTLAIQTPVVFVTGRPEEYRAPTIAWLAKHVIDDFDALFMRAAGDFRDDGIVKVELMHRVCRAGYAPVLAFEDRDRVVKAYREAGFPCAQVATGDF
jgi:hypothetical protein